MELAHFDVVEKFARKHARARSSLILWRDATVAARWKNFDDVKKTFRATDLYGDCVIFDIGGNNYRLIAKISYENELVSIKAVMTHAEYDKDKWKKNCSGAIRRRRIRGTPRRCFAKGHYDCCPEQAHDQSLRQTDGQGRKPDAGRT